MFFEHGGMVMNTMFFDMLYGKILLLFEVPYSTMWKP